MGKAFVIGVGMTKFEKPGRREWTYPEMAKEAGTNALNDAGIDYSLVEQAFVSYVNGASTAGQRAVYELGHTGIPVTNVNNNCSSGSTALFLARQAVEFGVNDCALALGFEQMQPGSLQTDTGGLVHPLDRHVGAMMESVGIEAAPMAPQMFGQAGREHMERYGSTPEMFAAVGEKNHRHSQHNPYAQFQDVYTLEEIMSAREIFAPLTLLQCSPTSDGSGAVIVASERFVREHGLEDKAVEIVAQSMVTDLPSSYEGSMIKMVGADMTAKAAREVYEKSGFGPEDVDVIELHDCFSANEIVTYEGLGICPEGEGGKYALAGATTYGGDVVVNPSGGLISKGHPLGATGLAQCSELTWQMRGEAGERQVPGAKLALQHNLGLGGAAVVTMYRKAELN